MKVLVLDPSPALDGLWRRHAEGWRFGGEGVVVEVTRERSRGSAFYRATTFVDGKRLGYADANTLARAKAHGEREVRMWVANRRISRRA